MKLLKRSLFLFSLPLATIGCLASINTAQAQISPDGTLSTTVTSPDGRNFTINDGNRAGGNLFHSFREFSVLTGGSAFFNNALDVQNIISRVTGGSVSNIDGLISANGAANLFLLNPAGVLFGPNASLNIGGSFLATTASSFVFPDGSEFSAINPQGAPLLTMNIPNGLRFRDNPGGIQVQGLGQTAGLIGTSVSFSNPTLEVPIGQTLALVGGNVSLDGGVLQAAGGRVEVGGLASSGDVEIQNDGVRPSVLLFPEGVQRADVTLTNQAGINTITDQFGGGSINITARNINISGRSLLTTGFFDGLGMVDPDVRAGDIVLNGIGETRIDESRIENNVNSGTTANGSNIFITTGSFVLNNVAQLDTSNFGSGFAGDVRINAVDQVSLNQSQIRSDGNFGRILIGQSNVDTPSPIPSVISINGSQLSTTNSNSSGFAGDIFLNARDQVSITNESIISSSGDRGRIFIGRNDVFSATSSPRIVTVDNSRLSSTNSNVMSAEDTQIDAGDVLINAIDSISLVNRSSINTFTERLGNAGNVTLRAENGDISLTEGSSIFSTVEALGSGDAGNIDVFARNLTLRDGAELISSVSGQGNAGSINIQASGDVLFTGFTNVDLAGNPGTFPSGVFSTVNAGAIGNGGNINITARNLSLANRSSINTFTRGVGNAGSVTLRVENGDISLTEGSSIFSTVEFGGSGDAGNIDVFARNLTLRDGAELISSVSGQGNAGSINIQASGDILFTGFTNTDLTGRQGTFPSGIFSTVNEGAIGNAGNIDVVARNLSLANRSSINTFTRGAGNAGGVTLRVENGDISLTEGSSIFSTVEFGGIGDAGNIDVFARNLTLRDGAQLASGVRGQGNAGSINIQASGNVLFTGFTNTDLTGRQGTFPSGALSTVEPTGRGNGGNINITARTFTLSDGAELQTLAFGFNGENPEDGRGNAGNVFVNANEGISLVNRSAIQTFTDRLGNAGNVTLSAENGDISLTDASAILSTVEALGIGNAGTINVTSRNLSLTGGGALTSSVRGQGNAGSINIQASGNVLFTGFTDTDIGNNSGLFPSGIFSTVEPTGRGNGDNINITARTFTLSDGAEVQTLVRSFDGENPEDGRGNAGNVFVNANEGISLVNRSSIETFTDRLGNAGSVTLRAENGDISLTGGSTIFSTVEQGGIGDAGTIGITSRNLSLTEGSQLQTLVRGQGNAGSITIQATENVFLTGFTDRDTTGDQGFFASAVLSRVNPGGIGNGGDITIEAGSLSLNDASFITTSTSGQGASGNLSEAGDISVQVDDSVTLANRSTIDSRVGQGGVGIGGDIDIRARSLTLTSGAEIGAVVFRAENGQPGGTGRAGNIDITATDFVDISGISTVGFSSGLFASAERGTTAISPEAAGNITVTTGNFRLADGAVVNALTSNTGRGGNITITANNFTATGGGQVLATSRDTGRAGDITLNVSNRTTLSGSDPNFDARLAQAAIDQANVDGVATDIVNNQGATSGIFANTTDDSNAQGGTLTINTRELTVENGAEVTVRSRQGQAGNLDITARTIRLNNGSLTAQTGRGGDQPGANINLQGLELLSLRNGSLISAEAFGDANGGNINIDAGDGLVVAIPRQNSDIIASAERGRGGNIQITAQAIFGLAVGRSVPVNLTNDIDASSEFNSAGSIEFITPDVDPSQGLVELPETVVDPSQQIAQNPCQQGASSEFVITGRGGLPTSPNQTLSGDSVRVDLLSPVASTTNAANTTLKTTQLNNSGVKRIVPAQGWIFNEKGQVVLTAYKPNQASSQRSWKTPTSCAAR